MLSVYVKRVDGPKLKSKLKVKGDGAALKMGVGQLRVIPVGAQLTVLIGGHSSDAYEVASLHRGVDTDAELRCGLHAVHAVLTALTFGRRPASWCQAGQEGPRGAPQPTMAFRTLADITINECRALPKMDVGLNATCDAYVTLELGSMMYKTWRVDNSLNPVFHGEDCTFVYQREHEPVHDEMLVTVYDYDRASADDLVGSVCVSVRELSADHGLFGRWYELIKGGKSRGWIKLSAQINREDQPSMLSRYGSLQAEIPFRLDYGDVVLFSGHSLSSNVISAVTASKWDHAAIVFRSERSKLYLLESTMAGVKIYPFDQRVRYFASHSTSFGFRRLLCQRTDRMKKALQDFSRTVIGVPYEKSFVELAAALSKSNKEDDLSSIFCSELVVAALRAMQVVPEETKANNFLPSRLSKGEMKHVLVAGAELGAIKKFSRKTFTKNEELRQIASDLREAQREQEKEDGVYGL